jgi:hypothetical protein
MAQKCEPKPAGQICPTCDCFIAGGGYEKNGVIYCCEPCANGGACECGCCKPVEGQKSEKESRQ